MSALLQPVHTPDAPAAVGPYSQAIKANGLVFVSGQIGFCPKTMAFASDNVEGQAQQALTNMQNILKAAGSDLEYVTKTTVLLVNMDDFAKVNTVYSKFFSSHLPARACYAVSGLPKNALVEIEATAVDPNHQKN
eukprot:TRINITY_DN8132_c0_g1_i1.p1 TRINITY_DN8132_c0_g1~~TRINITY_DN8132_c0_g1_i1.p1  ORF type:complete len:156 (-),score=25.29 TRINITY_DN8132_c0_g1_i1:16-420(-)